MPRTSLEGKGTSSYPGEEKQQPHKAVETRAARVPLEYIAKAKEADRKYNGHLDPLVPGPVLATLLEFGRIHGLVFGKFGEVSADVDALIRDLSMAGANLQWRLMGARSVLEARQCLLHRFRIRVGVASLRSMARLRLDTLSRALGFSSSSRWRRQRAKERFMSWRNEHFFRYSWQRRPRSR